MFAAPTTVTWIVAVTARAAYTAKRASTGGALSDVTIDIVPSVASAGNSFTSPHVPASMLAVPETPKLNRTAASYRKPGTRHAAVSGPSAVSTWPATGGAAPDTSTGAPVVSSSPAAPPLPATGGGQENGFETLMRIPPS